MALPALALAARAIVIRSVTSGSVSAVRGEVAKGMSAVGRELSRVPSIEMTFEVKGLKELEDNLIELGEEYGYRNVRTALNIPLKRAIAPVTQAIEQNTPIDTGALRRSIKTKLGRGPISKSPTHRGKGKSIVQAISTGWFTGEPGVTFKQMVAVEYGNRSQDEHMVIRNALEQNKDEVMEIFTKEWKTSLERTVNRLNKKRELGKLTVK